jgi:hypothetical protein
MQKEPETGRALFAELDAPHGFDFRYDELRAEIQFELSDKSQEGQKNCRIFRGCLSGFPTS